MPTVSILIPVFNPGMYFDQCLHALETQTFKDFEVIFLDDCSTDGSIVKAEEFKKNHPEINVTIKYHKTNGGTAKTRNELIALAKGEYVLFVDSDDWLEPNTLQLLVNSIGDADVLDFGYFEDRRDGTRIHECHYSNDRKKLMGDAISVRIDTSLCFKLVRRDIISQFSMPEGINMGEDYIMTILLYKHANSVKSIPNALYHYERKNATSFTRTAKPEVFIRLFDYVQELLQKENLLPEYQADFDWRRFIFKKDLVLSQNPDWKTYMSIYPELNGYWKNVSNLGKKNQILFWLAEKGIRFF